MNTKTLTSFSSRFKGSIWSTLRSWMNNPNPLANRKIAWFGLSAAILLAAGGTFVMLERKYPEITFTREDRLKVLDQQAQPYYDQAKQQVSSAVSSISLKDLCWNMACDKVSGNHNTQKYLRQKLHPVIAPCKAMANVYGVEADSRVFQNCVKEITSDSITDAVCAVSGLAIEALFIRSTLASLMKVCGVAIARITASMGAGAVCAVADGPFPIGDAIGVLIAVGGTAWSCYDLYSCSTQMQAQMNAALQNMIDQYREACRKAAVP